MLKQRRKELKKIWSDNVYWQVADSPAKGHLER